MPAAAPPKFTLSSTASTKALLHASRFPWASVIGLLLGRETPTGVDIVDAIPLFHTPVLAPMLEVACMLVEEHSNALNLKIVGLYAADDKLEAAAPSVLVARLASQICIKCKPVSCCLLLIDNQALDSESKQSFIPFLPSGSEWKPNPKALESAAGAATAFTRELKQSTVVHDFDDHFADVSADWRNLQVS